MSTTIHQTMSSLYLPDTNNIKYSCSIVFFHAEEAELRRVLTMQMEGGVAETRSGWNIRAKQSMSLRNLF